MRPETLGGVEGASGGAGSSCAWALPAAPARDRVPPVSLEGGRALRVVTSARPRRPVRRGLPAAPSGAGSALGERVLPPAAVFVTAHGSRPLLRLSESAGPSCRHSSLPLSPSLVKISFLFLHFSLFSHFFQAFVLS